MKKPFVYFLFSLMGLSVLITCSKDSASPSSNSSSTNTNTTCTTSYSYATDVSPIISSSCSSASCHGGKEKPTLTNYTQVSANSAAISSQVSSGKMPQGSTLTSDQKTKLLCWIQDGAKNN